MFLVLVISLTIFSLNGQRNSWMSTSHFFFCDFNETWQYRTVVCYVPYCALIEA